MATQFMSPYQIRYHTKLQEQYRNRRTERGELLVNQRKSMEEWERYIKNKERGINYLAPEEAKKLSPEWTSLGGNELTLEKRYSGQSGLIRMLQDKRLRNIAKMITGRIG